VAYAGLEQKKIPSWACNHEDLIQVKQWQDANMKPAKEFGILAPKRVTSKEVLDNLFAFAGDNHNERGSSANWNDESELCSHSILNDKVQELSTRPVNPQNFMHDIPERHTLENVKSPAHPYF